MITPDNLPSILEALAWPLVVLVFVVLCRNEIRALLKRLQKAKLPGGTEAWFEYGGASIDKVAQQPPPGAKAEPVAEVEHPTRNLIEWGNSGNLFWAGHDLMWTIDALLRNAPRETIVYGLQQSLHHVRSLGFTSTPIESRLARMKADAESTLQQDWTPSWRNSYANELGSIINYIGNLADKANQPDFESRPKE